MKCNMCKQADHDFEYSMITAMFRKDLFLCEDCTKNVLIDLFSASPNTFYKVLAHCKKQNAVPEGQTEMNLSD